jgi:uncharacterized membrane protein (DUF2068 family)
MVNPYSPPSTPVADIGDAGTTRPIGANVVFIYYAISLVGTLGSLLMLVLKVPNYTLHPTPGSVQFFGKFGLPWYTIFIPTAFLLICSIVQLYRLRKSAAYFGTAIFAVLLATRFWTVQELLRGGHPAMTRNYVVFAINSCIVVYLWRLVRNGILR